VVPARSISLFTLATTAENVCPISPPEAINDILSPLWVFIVLLADKFQWWKKSKADIIRSMDQQNELTIKTSFIKLIQGDITKQQVDAIVNAANSSLMGGGGVDGAIHKAGGPAILEECKEIVASQGRLPPGLAVITTGGKLLAHYVIHTVGPVWMGGSRGEAEILRSAYAESLQLAASKNLKSIAFPSISTGAYHYPLDKAAPVALNAVIDFLKEYKKEMRVSFVLFNEETYNTYLTALNQIKEKM
jgi:O-acetyl-ADP-ribose deacetylase (regulator of RNase III)